MTSEILANAFKTLAEEMSVIEYRSSVSPVIRESRDYDCAVFDPHGQLVASAEINPALLGATQFALQAVLERRSKPLKPGDVLLTNDPYLGGSHTPDLTVFSPVFEGDQLVGYVNSVAHHVDVGGRFPGSESALSEEIFQEGLIFSGILIVDGGERVEPVYDLIESNVRDPDATIADLDAQLAACRRGEERLLALCKRYGATTVLAAMDALIDRTAELAIEQFSSWPDRVVRAEGWLDDAGPGTEPARIVVELAVRDGRLTIDLTGTSEQAPWGLNVPAGSLKSTGLFIARYATGLPANAGLARQVDISAPAGTILNPKWPAPIGARAITLQRLAAVLVEALSELVPEKAIAASCVATPVHYFQAVDPRTDRLSVFVCYYGGGGGATARGPGDDGVDTYTVNVQFLPVEIIELEYPWRVLHSGLVPGSGGAGRHRGGMALRRDIELLAERANGTTYLDQTTPRTAASGMAGGGEGSLARMAVRRAGSPEWVDIPPKGKIEMSKGDAISVITAGGGGYGPPEDG
ncbi:MAG TPA: hydantoinase B/oxoprolinase family protein [Baekduia sp.]|nr:hydantoinase B/oxoprolinase family protein [Baekduia sp.]